MLRIKRLVNDVTWFMTAPAYERTRAQQLHVLIAIAIFCGAVIMSIALVNLLTS